MLILNPRSVFFRPESEALDKAEKRKFSGLSKVFGFGRRKWTVYLDSTGKKKSSIVSTQSGKIPLSGESLHTKHTQPYTQTHHKVRLTHANTHKHTANII